MWLGRPARPSRPSARRPCCSQPAAPSHGAGPQISLIGEKRATRLSTPAGCPERSEPSKALSLLLHCGDAAPAHATAPTDVYGILRGCAASPASPVKPLRKEFGEVPGLQPCCVLTIWSAQQAKSPGLRARHALRASSLPPHHVQPVLLRCTILTEQGSQTARSGDGGGLGLRPTPVQLSSERRAGHQP